MVSGNVVIGNQDGEKRGRFICSGQVLDAMFESLKATENYNFKETKVMELSRKHGRETITETLLLVPAISFELDLEENVVLSMKVSK